MIVTDNEAWADRAKYLTTQAKDNPVEYIHHEIGYNYRLTNIQAAMGCAQMEKLEEYIAAKRRIAATYDDAFSNVAGLTPMPQASWAESIFWMYTLLVDEAEYGMDSRQLLQCLQEAKIQARPLWEPLHLSRAHAENQPQTLAVSEQLNRRALSLPCSVGLTEEDQARVIATVLKEKQ